MALSNTDLITELYIGYYNRAPDPAGLQFWLNSVNNGMTMAQVADLFATSSESTAIYPYLTLPGVVSPESFVIQVYNNVLNRAPDDAGKAFWINELQAGKVTAGGFIKAIVDTVNMQTGTPDALTLQNKVTVGEYYVSEIAKANVPYTSADAKAALAGVTNDASTVVSSKATVDATVQGGTPGQTYDLKTDVENITGTTGADTFNGTDKTVVLDTLNGGGGKDTLNYSDTAAGGTDINSLGLSLTSIETINARGIGAVKVTTTGFADVTAVNVTQATTAAVTAATTQNVTVTGATGAITVDGGKDISVTDSTAGNAITIGAATVGAGTVTVTDSKVGAADIKVDGGTDVTITATGSTGGANTIEVGTGGAATDLPTGAVKVTSAHTGVAATDVTLNAIKVSGGSTVSVTQTADTSKAATDATGATLTQGAVTVVGGDTTKSVTVSQAASTAEVLAVTAVAGANETASVKFSALTAGQTLIAGGLTFTAAKALTASEVAQAFSNLINGTVPVAGDTQGSGIASNGTYSGAFTGWTSGAASGDTVVFTSTTQNNVGNLTFGGTGAAPVVTTTDGVLAVTGVTGVLGVIDGTVLIDDNATASITTVSVDGYGNGSSIGSTATLSKLTDLTLAHSGGATAGATNGTMTVDAAGVASLNLTLNKVLGAVSLDGAGDNALKTLNVTTTGAASSFLLTAAAVEALTVAGDHKATFTADLAALKTVTVSGSAGLTLSGAETDTLTSVNTTATTGAVTLSIDGTKATYTGGAGVDTVTLATGTALTKAIDLGAGDDTLIFGAAVSGSTATLSGGDGTDTLSMTVAHAAALDATKQTFYTNFEHLTISDAYGTDNDSQATETLDLANLGFTHYVTTSGTVADTTTAANSDVLVLDKMATDGTVVLTAQGLIQVNVTDASTGTADVLNLQLSSSSNLTAGTLTAANVETINISTIDTEAAPQTKNVDTLTLTADSATSVNLSGAADLTLTLTGSTKVTAIDAHSMTGGLTVTSLNTTSATTITGGAGNDVLTAATGTTADVLIGGAGDDVLTSNAGLTTMTGGEGRDVFSVGAASQNVNSYATITDFGAGDLIKFTGSDSFAAAKVTLGDTAVFQDYANAAINAVGADDLGWFQFSGNTYIVMDAGADTTTFTNGQDMIVKLTGLVDLTNASYNVTQGTIALT